MSQSCSALPLPESQITFATLSRRARREKTGLLGNIRHSRTFSTFQPVQVRLVHTKSENRHSVHGSYLYAIKRDTAKGKKFP